ncbi:MAG: tetratricopeptide repeat protein [Pseudomonadota bacterium]
MDPITLLILGAVLGVPASMIGTAALDRFRGRKWRWRNALSALPSPIPRKKKSTAKGLRIILCTLEHDEDDRQTKHIRTSLRSALETEKAGCPFEVIRHRGVLVEPDEDSTEAFLGLQRKIDLILDRHAGDILIFGEVVVADKRLRLKFGQHGGQSDQKGYSLTERFELPTDFQTDLTQAVVARLIGLCAISTEEQGGYLVERMTDVARRMEHLAANPPPGLSPFDLWQLDHSYGLAKYCIGLQAGRSKDLQISIDAFQSSLTNIARDTHPDAWSRTYNNLGSALLTLGGRETGTERLEQAITAYTEALKERTRERVPLAWAKTQTNMGIALRTLGNRESGTEHLEQAVAAYSEALKECTRDRVPLDWAMTQTNLGIALRALSERESGTERLEQAVAAHTEALKERTRDRVPLQWATTQMTLGTALLQLGERETGTVRLEEAVTAYSEALKENTRDRVPLDWAMTQMNLGTALRILGTRETGTESLEQAIIAFTEALKEYTRDRVPLDWAATQMNLGFALWRLGERETGTDRLKQAIAAFTEALNEHTRDRVPLQWATTQINLGGVEAAFFDKSGDIAHLDRADGYYHAALEVFEEAGATHYINMIQGNLEVVKARRAKAQE